MDFSYDSGINNQGDFDQLSLAGVDFGADYCEDYGINPTNLEGEIMFSGSLDQLGSYYDQMGVVPEGLGADFNQMGIVPEGLGHDYQQMGIVPSGLGSQYSQLGSYNNQLGIVPSGLGFMDKWNTMSKTNKILVGAGAAVAALFLAKKLGYVKKLPLIG